MTAEHRRLARTAAGKADWQRWGTYVSDRARQTVREDYSADGNAWAYVPHDHARSRAYRWNEDALAVGYVTTVLHGLFAAAQLGAAVAATRDRRFARPRPPGSGRWMIGTGPWL